MAGVCERFVSAGGVVWDMVSWWIVDVLVVTVLYTYGGVFVVRFVFDGGGERWGLGCGVARRLRGTMRMVVPKLLQRRDGEERFRCGRAASRAAAACESGEGLAGV
ncbi:hypothetical protein Tco_0885751 [Tanacetum coccineum]